MIFQLGSTLKNIFEKVLAAKTVNNITIHKKNYTEYLKNVFENHFRWVGSHRGDLGAKVVIGRSKKVLKQSSYLIFLSRKAS